MTRIVTTHYRYKRPPGRKKRVALEVPAVVKAADPAKAHRTTTSTKRAGASAEPPAPPAHAVHRPAIVTTRRPRATVSLPDGLLPDTPVEYRRRGDAADAMWRELVRRVAEKT